MYSTSPIVLLCGGKVEIKTRADDPDPPIRSLRHAITNTHTGYEIFRPEEISNWQVDGVFPDLISFERDLASICTLVVIILESAGALVELGAFSQLPELSKKLIAIQSAKYTNDISFINLGILRYIAEQDDSCVKSYPWIIECPTEIDTEVVGDVVSDVQEYLDKLPKSQLARLADRSHVMILICELINLFSALKEGEIFDYLGILNIPIPIRDLRGKLFLLREFRLIKAQRYSDATFYIRSTEPYHKLRLVLSDGEGNFDELREQAEFLRYYAADPRHRNRIRALRDSRAGGDV